MTYSYERGNQRLASQRLKAELEADEKKLAQTIISAMGPRDKTRAKLSGSTLTFDSSQQMMFEKAVRAMKDLGWGASLVSDLADKVALSSGPSEAASKGTLPRPYE